MRYGGVSSDLRVRVEYVLFMNLLIKRFVQVCSSHGIQSCIHVLFSFSKVPPPCNNNAHHAPAQLAGTELPGWKTETPVAPMAAALAPLIVPNAETGGLRWERPIAAPIG